MKIYHIIGVENEDSNESLIEPVFYLQDEYEDFLEYRQIY